MNNCVAGTSLLVLLLHLLHQPQLSAATSAAQPFPPPPPPPSPLWGQPGWDDRRSFCTASSVPLQAPALQWSSSYNSSWWPSGPLVVDSNGNIFGLLVSASPPWQYHVSRWSAADGRQEAGPLLCAGGSVQPPILAGGCVVSSCGTYNSARATWAYELISVFPAAEPSGCTLQLPWRPPQSDTLLLGLPSLGVDSSCQALLVQLQYTTTSYTRVNTQLWRLDSAGGAPTLLAELCPTPPPLTPSCSCSQGVLSRGTLFLLCDIGLQALDMEGQPPLQPPVMVQAGASTCFSFPVASTEGTVFCSSREGGGVSGGRQLLGFNATGPLPLPAVQVGNYVSLGPGPEALIVTLAGSTLLGLSQQGQLVWSTPLPDDFGLSATAATVGQDGMDGGLSVGQDGTVVLLLSLRAGLLAYSAASGLLLWRNSSVVAPVNRLAATIGLSSVVLLNYSSMAISLLASSAEGASASASSLPSPSLLPSGTPSQSCSESPSSAPAASPGSSALSPLLLAAAVGVGGALLLGAAALYFYFAFKAQQPNPPSRFLAQGVGEDGAELDPAEYGALN